MRVRLESISLKLMEVVHARSQLPTVAVRQYMFVLCVVSMITAIGVGLRGSIVSNDAYSQTNHTSINSGNPNSTNGHPNIEIVPISRLIGDDFFDNASYGLVTGIFAWA